MVLLRAKFKVRYALLVLAVSALSYVSLQRSLNVNEIFRHSQLLPEQNIRSANVIHRSLRPAWHEGRELLNEVPRTHKTQNLNKPFNNKTDDTQKNVQESDSLEENQPDLINKQNSLHRGEEDDTKKGTTIQGYNKSKPS